VNHKYGNRDCSAYRDFRELLARSDIDVVLIATGDRWHPLLSIAAARAGKDIYCEKPVSLTIEEAKVMREVIRRHRIVFQMGTQQRSSYQFRFACELVRNGYIGDVKEVVVAVGGPVSKQEKILPPQPVPDYLDYDFWLGPIPWRPYHPDFVAGWMGFRDCAGGEMTNWGAHHFDIAQWGLGMDSSGPVEIHPPDGKENFHLTYHYASGARMTRDPERMKRETGQDNGILFVGEKGKVAVWRYALETWPPNLVRQRLGPNEIHLHACDNHHTDFLNSVRSRQEPGSNLEIGCRSITVCHLGNIAYELGRPIRWDPGREEFVNDPTASRLLARAMRPPWHL
jgi:predicted dehydrogenase